MKNKETESVFGLLLPELARNIAEAGYTTPTPIQQQAIPPLLQGRDMLGCAQTGTGKTAAFMLPILNYLVGGGFTALPVKPRVLILAPTRELAAQIGDSVLKYGRNTGINRVVIFGGVGQFPQVKAVRKGVHIVVATPGRLLDLVKQKHLDLGGIDIFVLDEADRMLDMGFLPDIRQIIERLPSRRQSLFFSATMDKAVVELAHTLVHKPARITIEPEKPAVELIDQKVMFVNKEDKDNLLIGLLQNSELNRVIVFTQMKHMANRVQEKLEKAGIQSECIHGDKGQLARTQALRNFKTGRTRVLIATDIASRGIDVESVSHVINYDLPQEAETYIHRIGRTARAGAEGDAISFCSARERDFLRAIEKLLRKPIPVDLGHGLHSADAMNAKGLEAKPLPRRGGGGQSRQRPSGGAQGRRPHGASVQKSGGRAPGRYGRRNKSRRG